MPNTIRVTLSLLTACVLLAWTTPAKADTDPAATELPAEPGDDTARPWRLTLHLENDSAIFIPNSPSDRAYTNGTGITFAWRPAFADTFAERLPDFGGDFGDAPATAFGVQAAQLIFTPENIDLERPQPDDRPFAGYLFGGAYWQRAGARTFDHVQLDVGVVGSPAGAEPVQELVHDIFSESADPAGWDNQVSDEPALQFTLRRKWRTARDSGTFELGGMDLRAEGIAGAELELGNVLRQAEGSLLGRVGFNLPDDFGPGRIFEPRSFTGDPQRRWSFYLFGRLSGRLVEHNFLLEGSDFRPSNDHPTVTPQPFVGEAALGLDLAYRGARWAFGFNYAQVYSMQEFDEQNDNHSYGRYALSLRHKF
ncbi:MAG: lipid A deacylase LpxR family protein [Phycisphaeraceae bacterium]